jgi:hypothetical protein
MAEQGGFGVVYKITVASTLTTVAGVMKIEFPKQSKVVSESTGHDAVSGYRTFVDTGIRELESFNATLRWDKLAATHAAHLTAFNSKTPVALSIQDPLGQEIIAFSAHIETIARIGEMEEVFTAEVTIRPTGAPTITP